eukprot:TRINITY_DN3213_c0_g1_i1.p1 TRINITY_DN3213_c0_g1~~TRINITY_DN3213_c0_g1_i1.p1  ORF type:complete len:313 (+),score=52.16 TRINITY_DN3213_c0_g1_i1:200-1138(+)
MAMTHGKTVQFFDEPAQHKDKLRVTTDRNQTFRDIIFDACGREYNVVSWTWTPPHDFEGPTVLPHYAVYPLDAAVPEEEELNPFDGSTNPHEGNKHCLAIFHLRDGNQCLSQWFRTTYDQIALHFWNSGFASAGTPQSSKPETPVEAGGSASAELGTSAESSDEVVAKAPEQFTEEPAAAAASSQQVAHPKPLQTGQSQQETPATCEFDDFLSQHVEEPSAVAPPAAHTVTFHSEPPKHQPEPAAAEELPAPEPGWRKGLCCFNVLWGANPDLEDATPESSPADLGRPGQVSDYGVNYMMKPPSPRKGDIEL